MHIWAPKSFKQLEFVTISDDSAKQMTLRDELKCCVLGQAWVGKSASSLRFISGTFFDGYDPTIEDSLRKQLYIKDWGSLILEILDTAGTEDFSSLRDQWITESDVIYFVYDIMNPSSLNEIDALYEKCCDIKPMDDLMIVLCGNKVDLVGDWGRCPKKETIKSAICEACGDALGSLILDFLGEPQDLAVTTQEALELAQRMSAVFYETSAKTDVNIVEAFESAVSLYVHHQEKMRFAQIEGLHFDSRTRTRASSCCCTIS